MFAAYSENKANINIEKSINTLRSQPSQHEQAQTVNSIKLKNI